MAEVKFAKGSEEWQMFMDYWSLCQKYWKPEDTDEWWEKLVSATNNFSEKYGTEFARSLSLSLVSEAYRKQGDK